MDCERRVVEAQGWDKFPEFPLDTRFKVVRLPWVAVDKVLEGTKGVDVVCGPNELAKIITHSVEHVQDLDGGTFDDAHLSVLDTSTSSQFYPGCVNIVSAVTSVTRNLLMARQTGVIGLGNFRFPKWQGVDDYEDVIMKNSDPKYAYVIPPRIIPESPHLVPERIYKNVDGGVVTFSPKIDTGSLRYAWVGKNKVNLSVDLPILINAMNGVADLHSVGIIHRDISTGNILKSGQICDFELSVDKKDYSFDPPYFGTPVFMQLVYISQRILKKALPEYDDIFSLAMMLIMLCFDTFDEFWTFLAYRFDLGTSIVDGSLTTYGLSPREFTGLFKERIPNFNAEKKKIFDVAVQMVHGMGGFSAADAVKKLQVC